MLLASAVVWSGAHRQRLPQNLRELFLARRPRVDHDVAALHRLVDDVGHVLFAQARIATALSECRCHSARLRDSRRRAAGAVERRAAADRLAERSRHRDESLRRGAAVELHHQRQRHGDRDAVRNLQVPAAERHRERVRQAEPRRVHRHAGHRAGQQHRVARLAVARRSAPRREGAGQSSRSPPARARRRSAGRPCSCSTRSRAPARPSRSTRSAPAASPAVRSGSHSATVGYSSTPPIATFSLPARRR